MSVARPFESLWRNNQDTATRAFLSGNAVTLLRDGVEAFPAMLEAIKQAKEQILLEMYWFASDAVGQEFAHELARAAQGGVEVALIYDGVGSLDSSPAMFDFMREAGVLIREYNPVFPWKRNFRWQGLFYRDHRKILATDGCVAFTGGINLTTAWSPVEENGQNWRDDMIRVKGPIVREIVACFKRTWSQCQGSGLGDMHLSSGEASSSDQQVRVLTQDLVRNRSAVRKAYIQAIDQAKTRIWISNSYFIPDRRVRAALSHAVRRGVDVRVITPGRSDVPLAYYAGRATFTTLLKKGIQIYQWQGSMLHSKTAVIDGSWSTIGTFNLDHRSFRFSLELNVAVQDSGFAAVMEASFRHDLENSKELNLTTFCRRPWRDRMLEQLCYRFRKLL